MSAHPLPEEALDRLLEQARAQLDLEADTERDVLDELRCHLEEGYTAARSRGLSEEQALAEAARRAGLEEAARVLQATHQGWGTADGVLAAAVPVVCTHLLRWLVVPQGGLTYAPPFLSRPEFWVMALMALALPLMRLRRWRYALASWVFFWALSLAFIIEGARAH